MNAIAYFNPFRVGCVSSGGGPLSTSVLERIDPFVRYLFELTHRGPAQALTSASLSCDPLADISCAIHQCDAIRLAALEKADRISTSQS